MNLTTEQKKAINKHLSDSIRSRVKAVMEDCIDDPELWDTVDDYLNELADVVLVAGLSQER